MPIGLNRPPIRPLVWSGLLILYLVWGSTYLGIAIAIETIPPFLMGAARFIVAGSVLLTWSFLREGRGFELPSRSEWRDTFVVGALLLGGGMGLVAWGEQTIPSGIAALFIALMPVWVALLGRIFLGERLPRLAVAGIVIGVAGVAILVNPTGSPADRLDPAGVAAVVLSPVLWASGSLYAAHRAKLPSRPLVSTGAQMLAGAVVLTGLGLVTGEATRLDIPSISAESFAALAYLTVIGSLVAFTAYGWLLRVAPLPLVATYAYVNPIVAVILGALILAEPITPRTVMAGAVIIFAVALIITTRNRIAGPAARRSRPRSEVPSPSVNPRTEPVPLER